jgi:hypothetical protein
MIEQWQAGNAPHVAAIAEEGAQKISFRYNRISQDNISPAGLQEWECSTEFKYG